MKGWNLNQEPEAEMKRIVLLDSEFAPNESRSGSGVLSGRRLEDQRWGLCTTCLQDRGHDTRPPRVSVVPRFPTPMGDQAFSASQLRAAPLEAWSHHLHILKDPTDASLSKYLLV
ncbi:hypothetical protein PGT21_025914 [Puccinia graminis f. sp. tritici]|uniref:Uncharacterized protein n=1 Tax=Puccinia graminis f. sp. tritici TaxID=56615 RepID=A0A5B0QC69_PUCGR|nr:hypothetical protein PGT21_025914 [Puccinia graminis f. sp. tritici]